MGIYPDHGVEYHVVFKNNTKYVIANTKTTDDRLLKSKYLEKRYDKWMNLCQSQCIPLQNADELDIELEDIEKQRLDKILNENKNEVLTHGWYDVCSIWDTYGDSYFYGTNNDLSAYYVVLKDGKKIKVGSKEILDEHDKLVFNSILNVYDDKVVSHEWQ